MRNGISVKKIIELLRETEFTDIKIPNIKPYDDYVLLVGCRK